MGVNRVGQAEPKKAAGVMHWKPTERQSLAMPCEDFFISHGMSASGHSRRLGHVGDMSGLPPTADVSEPGRHFAFVPNPDMVDAGRGKEKAARRRLSKFEMRESGEAMLRPILLPAISSCSEARTRGSGVKLPAARRQSATPAR
jgi:hypothetical protein